ncbi:MAG TPA: hypothetical protein VM261_00005, partial [Kofleriaceae bacterium]|nr:hypothetical protein [Kofleriaceae bacterium]
MHARGLVVVMVVMTMVGTAAADGTTFEGKVKTAESAERSAHESKDPAAYEVCGQAYLEVAEAARTEMPDSVASAMYNAAVCFEEGGSVSAAITLYKQLEREFPSDRAVPRVVARRAQIYMRLAWYDEAAD